MQAATVVRRGPLEPALLLKQPFRTFSFPVLCNKEGSALQLVEGLKAGQATSCFPPRLPEEEHLVQLSCCAAWCPVAATAAAAAAAGGAAVVTRDDGCSNCGVA